MFSTSRLFLTLAVLTLTAVGLSPTLAGAEGSRFVDRLGTLTLDQELDNRGNLGGVTVDRLGFLYVANFRDAVWRISPDGAVTTLTRSLYGASGNAVDSRGDLLQANFFGNTITKISRIGEVSLFAGQGLTGPVGIAIDPKDVVYVCNCGGNTLSRIQPSGEVEVFAKSDLFACPNGITFGGEDDLFVTNFNHQDILRVSPQGDVERFVTVPGGAGNAHIAYSKGFFYVTKIMAHRLVKVSTSGEITPLAGTGQPGHEDGPALEATLHRPNGIAVAPTGDMIYFNTLVGEYSKPKPSRLSVRTLKLMTLTRAMDEARQRGAEAEELTEIYHRYKADPVRGRENTVAEMIAYGYSFLQNLKVAEALTLFRLNAESYPDTPVAQYQLGEAYRYAGQTEQAIAQYEKTLTLDPDHAGAASRLKQLGASG